MTSSTSVESELSQSPGWLAALEEARHGFAEGGLPIGACVVSKTGKILGRGRNRLVQNGTPQMHGEMSALASCGRLHAAEFRGATIFTTLSPCAMCTGAILLYGFGRVVIGEAESESKQKGMGGEEYLRSKGVEVVDLGNSECKEMMREFVEANLELCRTEPWFVDD